VPEPELPGAVEAARAIAEASALWRRGTDEILVVAIDGHGASGKSTVSGHLAARLEIALVHGDDFFRARGAGDLGCYYERERLRRDALEPLRAGRPARYVSSDPFTPGRAGTPVAVAPAPVIVVEVVGAAASELSDLVDRTVLVDTPEVERLARLRERVDPQDWDLEWLEAERAHFANRPRSSFDLIVSGSARGGQRR
jgi:uridine kinase